MKRLAFAVVAVSLAMTGCSGSLCDDVDSANKDLADKVKGCSSFSEITYKEPTDAEREQCEKSVEACTDSDKEAIEKFLDCVSDLPACTNATEQQFGTSFLACANGVANISDACLDMSGASIRNAAAYSRTH